MRDHLGNTRATLQGGALTSQTNYYPFGLTFYDGASQGNMTLNQNRYLYNGKELQDDFGLDWYDYGARFYDAQIARWHSVDPHAENYYNASPYAYVLNNPIFYVDPNGRDARVSSTTDSLGNVTYTIQSTIYITGHGASEKRAERLNKYAAKHLESHTVKNEDGTESTVQFDVNFVYVENQKDIELKEGDNILQGVSDKQARQMGLQHSIVVGIENDQIATAGNIGFMVGGFNNNTALHESLHMLGLSDRYTEDYIQIDGRAQRRTTPHIGFENDIMGVSGATTISNVHYNNYVNYFNGKGNFILKLRVDRRNRRLLP